MVKTMIQKVNILLMLLCLGLFFGCGSSPKELYETAELEMLQTNYPHATKLYQEIIDKHPKSEFAATAKVRLKEIQKKTSSQ